MIHLNPWSRINTHVLLRLLIGHRTSLATSVYPFEKQEYGLLHKTIHCRAIEGYSIVQDMPTQFGTERFPKFSQSEFIAGRFTPLVDTFEFHTQFLAAAFHLSKGTALLI